MKSRHIVSALAALALAVIQPLTASAGDAAALDLAVRGTAGFPQYRIPALTTAPDGALIAAYDGRPSMADLPSRISVLVRRSTDGGATWSAQRVVRSGPAPEGYGDPSLLTDRETGRIFLFYAGAVNQGFLGSHTGNDDTDPDILHADYSYSDDSGRTWHHRRITSQIKDPAWGGLFASSGEGIQLRHGPHAGRLVQQYTVRYQGRNYAASAYSDDHGATWRMGEPAGPGADENKTVELADGTVLLNVRAAPHRLVARSTDGGVTYGPLRADDELIDPANNGAVTRYAPDAAASDPRSHWLVFSNTADTGIRRNLTLRMSCDDGETWPVSKVVEPGSAGYSTVTPLGGGRFGLLYEREGYRTIRYASFDRDRLGGVCAPVTVRGPDALRAGATTRVTIGVRNQTGSATAPGTLALTLPDGWSAPAVAVPRMDAGAGAEVSVPVTVPAYASPSADISAEYRVQGRRSSGSATLKVTAGADAPSRPGLSALPVLDHFDAAGADGVAGDVMTYLTRVADTGNTTLTDITVDGAMDGLPACHYSSLAPGQSYVCRTGKVTVTGADLERGFYRPELTVSATTPGGERVGVRATGERITLR